MSSTDKEELGQWLAERTPDTSYATMTPTLSRPPVFLGGRYRKLAREVGRWVGNRAGWSLGQIR